MAGQGFILGGFGFLVSGFGFRVSDFGFRVWGFGFRVSGFWCRVQVSGFGFRVAGIISGVSGLRLRAYPAYFTVLAAEGLVLEANHVQAKTAVGRTGRDSVLARIPISSANTSNS